MKSQKVRLAADEVLNYIRTNQGHFDLLLEQFVTATPLKDPYKIGRFKSLFENACSLDSYTAIGGFLSDNYCCDLLFSKETSGSIFLNGFYVAAYHGHQKTLNELNLATDNFRKVGNVKELYTEAMLGCLAGNQVNLYDNYLDKLIGECLSDNESIDLLEKIGDFPNINFDRGLFKRDDGEKGVSIIFHTFKKLNLTKAPSSFFKDSFFTRVLNPDEAKVAKEFIDTNSLELISFHKQLIAANPTGTFSKLLLMNDLVADLKTDLPQKSKLKI